MPISAGTRFGPYEISELIGSGGMGEVYRARDTDLRRDVALKFLPLMLANDADRVARFQREAEVLASLNHPNIAQIYGLERSDGATALAMELVEGPTLAERVALGRIPEQESLKIATQIADALEAAHERGIVHRDLKPANIKLKADGTVKVLDFGIAKVLEARATGPALAATTEVGLVLGTAAYMSPEQASGQPVDERADIWAFGCVLYEMLTGHAAFAGQTVSDTVTAVLGGHPDWGALTAMPATTELLRWCLEKQPRKRLRAIGDARRLLGGELPTASHPTTKASRWARAGWSLVAAALIGTTVVSWHYVVGRASPEALLTRLDVLTPPTSDPVSFALSPDGRDLVFVAQAEQGAQLWRRALDQSAAEPLAGTAGATFPFWAPDGRAIGFFADGKLKRLDFDGRAPLVLAEAPSARGGTWSRAGVIVFAPANTGGLMQVAAAGGTPAPVTRQTANEGSHRFPAFLPDGSRFLYFVGQSRGDVQGVYLGSLDGRDNRRLVEADSAAEYVPGFVLLVRQGVLVAAPFDEARGVLAGDPVPIAPGARSSALARGAFSASLTGLVAYRTDATVRQQLEWVDRAGVVTSALGSADHAFSFPELTPDGGRVAVEAAEQGNTDVWLLDSHSGVTDRFTLDPSSDGAPVWSPDGSRVAFRSNRNGSFDLFEKPANGARDETVLLTSTSDKFPTDWSHNGRVLLYVNQDQATGSDIWALPLEGAQEPVPVVRTRFAEDEAQFSPDDRWIAYRSNESGRLEVYVRPFPGPGGARRVSVAGGNQPRWRRDGKELFYVASDDKLMAVSIAERPGSDLLDVGTPMSLFSIRLAGAGFPRAQYAVSPDGERFLMNVIADQGASHITIVQNWSNVRQK